MARTPKVVEERREQIIDAALLVFAEKGFARATNREIAQRAGITSGLIYYYFKSKEELLRAALEERSPLQITVQMGPEMLEQPPEVFLPQVLMRVLGIVESERFVSLIRIVVPEVMHGSGEVAPIALSVFQRVLAFLSRYLQAQVERGSVRGDLDPQMMAQFLVSHLIGLVIRRQILGDPGALQFSHEELTRSVLETFCRGILARP
ncbi:MAG: TetR/AcrR family transcriptional regulator [Ktedonobacteraceae bacterium]|nr:TetR/AcrR family transcriptional regulator [Ktedonobacteraceae bacterium]